MHLTPAALRLPAPIPRHTYNRGRMTANARTGQPFHLGDMTMKVLCISKWAKAPSPEERDAILPKEVPATLKLYLDGVIEQMWFKLDAPGVVFLVNVESVDAAKTPRPGPADGPSRADGLRLHPGRAAGSARHADRRKVSVPGAADMTSVPILIGGAAGATGSVATKLLLQMGFPEGHQR